MDTKDTDFFNLEEELFDTVICSDISFSGKIKFTKPLLVRGKISGEVEATSDFVVDDNAVVNANVRASRVLVKGRVEGNITGDSIVFVSHTGVVNGDITAEQVVLEPGSNFSGRCTMRKKNI